MCLIDFLNKIGCIQFNAGVVKLENYYIINELLNLVFNINIVFYPSIGLVLLLYYIAEFSTIMVLVLYCIQKSSIAHNWYSLQYLSAIYNIQESMIPLPLIC